jgi:DNA-binding XRE family transcriptional regulator
MSVRMKKHPTNSNSIIMSHEGTLYQFPKKIADKYKLSHHTSPAQVFEKLNQQFTKPGALLRGIRIREGLTQVEMAKKIKVTQSDISQMESGVRNIGRTIAKRIEKLYGTDYRSFL